MNIIDLYKRSINGYAPLTREEEVELSAKIRQGDRAAIRKLVVHNLKFVIAVAKGYGGQGLPLEDLISAGNIGLEYAARKYDGRRGNKFISFAVWHVRKEILLALAGESRSYTMPIHRVNELMRVERAIDRIEQREHRPAEAHEIAKETDLEGWEVEIAVNNLGFPRISLDAPARGAEGTSLCEMFPGNMPEPDVIADARSLRAALRREVSMLDPTHRQALTMIYGLDGSTKTTAERAGRSMGMTRQAASAACNRAKTLLKKRLLAAQIA